MFIISAGDGIEGQYFGAPEPGEQGREQGNWEREQDVRGRSGTGSGKERGGKHIGPVVLCIVKLVECRGITDIG